MTQAVNTLQVSVLSPTSTPYSGPAVSLTAHNKVGEFDVLYGHQNFFSLLDKGDVAIDTGSEKLHFTISSGLIKVAHNEVTIFIDIGSLS